MDNLEFAEKLHSLVREYGKEHFVLFMNSNDNHGGLLASPLSTATLPERLTMQVQRVVSDYLRVIGGEQVEHLEIFPVTIRKPKKY